MPSSGCCARGIGLPETANKGTLSIIPTEMKKVARNRSATGQGYTQSKLFFVFNKGNEHNFEGLSQKKGACVFPLLRHNSISNSPLCFPTMLIRMVSQS